MAETKLVVDDLHRAFAAEAGGTLPGVGRLRPDPARGLVDGEDATGRTEPFAYMPQQDLLFPWRTVLDNAALGLQVAGMRRRAARERARALFEPFGLTGF